MNSPAVSTPSRTILYVALAFVAGLLLTSLLPPFGAAAGADAGAQGESDTPSRVNNVVLSFMYETSAGSAAGHNALEVDEIRFFPNYVLVTDSRGETQLLAISRLRNFSIHPNDK
ncbi:MAG: hypothetical protein R3B96_23000 [Pirellulaceae bacterium]